MYCARLFPFKCYSFIYLFFPVRIYFFHLCFDLFQVLIFNFGFFAMFHLHVFRFDFAFTLRYICFLLARFTLHFTILSIILTTPNIFNVRQIN